MPRARIYRHHHRFAAAAAIHPILVHETAANRKRTGPPAAAARDAEQHSQSQNPESNAGAADAGAWLRQGGTE